MHRTLLLTALAMVMTTMQAKTIYVATDGSDDAAGTIEAPMATMPAAYKKISNGDTICFRGGTYHVTDEQVMKTDNTYAYVFALEKAGTATKRTCIMGYPGERPVFDFSALQLDGAHRFSAFYLGANYLHLRNFDIVGVPVRIKGHTQSECVSARKGSHCIVENIAMHDGMAIGYYQTAGSDNLVLNCDAYNNYDAYSEGEYGGNVDGFGIHVQKTTDTGNVIRYCRAWRNSDDGFDLINNKAHGLYSNHHLGGCRWEYNSSWMNRSNNNMVNRKSNEEAVDVPGYGHILKNNVSFTFTDSSKQGKEGSPLAQRQMGWAWVGNTLNSI